MFNIQQRSEALSDLNLDTGINYTGKFSLIYIFNIFLEFLMNSKLNIRFKHKISAIILTVKIRVFCVFISYRVQQNFLFPKIFLLVLYVTRTNVFHKPKHFLPCGKTVTVRIAKSKSCPHYCSKALLYYASFQSFAAVLLQSSFLRKVVPNFRRERTGLIFKGGNVRQDCDFSALEYRTRTLSRKIENHIPENGNFKIITE